MSYTIFGWGLNAPSLSCTYRRRDIRAECGEDASDDAVRPMNEDGSNQTQAPKSCVWDGIVTFDRPSRQTPYCKSNVNHTPSQSTPSTAVSHIEALQRPRRRWNLSITHIYETDDQQRQPHISCQISREHRQ